MDIYNSKIEYRQALRQGHMLKLSFDDIGMYIDGFRLIETKDGWWFQPPARQVNGKWKPTVEFDKDMDYWQRLEAEAIKIVTERTSTSRRTGKDEVYDLPPDEVLNNPVKMNAYLSDSMDRTLGEL